MSTFKDICLIVLDIDDTLYLERDYVRSGFNAVGTITFEAYGNYCFELFEQGVRGNTFDLARTHFSQYEGVIPETHQLVEVYRNHVPQIRFCEDARQFLQTNAGRQLAAITDGPVSSQRAKFDALGLKMYVQEGDVMYTALTGHPKPSTHAYLELQQKFVLKPEQCLYIADNPHKDFIAPQKLGWQSLRIRRPLSLHEASDTPLGIVEAFDLSDVQFI